MGHAPPPRATFQPRFTLSLLYFCVLFLLYCVVLVLPELSQIEPPSGPEQAEAVKQAAAEAARAAIRPRLPIALVLTLGTLFLGARFRLLPGLSSR